MLNHSEAPPSPSTSSNHSSSLGKNKGKNDSRLRYIKFISLNRFVYSARDLSASAQRKYGSIDNCTPYLGIHCVFSLFELSHFYKELRSNKEQCGYHHTKSLFYNRFNNK